MPQSVYSTRYAEEVPQITKTLSRRSGSWIEVFAAGFGSIRLPVDEVPTDICPGAEISEVYWSKLTRSSYYFTLLDTCLKMLGRRDHFEAELRRKLKQRQPDEQIVDRVIDYCRSREYLNDDRALNQTIERLQSRGPMGAAKVKSELFRLGCPSDLIPKGVEIFESGVDVEVDLERAVTAKRRHFVSKLESLRRKAAKAPYKQTSRTRALRQQLMSAVYAFLRGRGFSSEQCSRWANKLVEELWDD